MHIYTLLPWKQINNPTSNLQAELGGKLKSPSKTTSIPLGTKNHNNYIRLGPYCGLPEVKGLSTPEGRTTLHIMLVEIVKCCWLLKIEPNAWAEAVDLAVGVLVFYSG